MNYKIFSLDINTLMKAFKFLLENELSLYSKKFELDEFNYKEDFDAQYKFSKNIKIVFEAELYYINDNKSRFPLNIKQTIIINKKTKTIKSNTFDIEFHQEYVLDINFESITFDRLFYIVNFIDYNLKQRYE